MPIHDNQCSGSSDFLDDFDDIFLDWEKKENEQFDAVTKSLSPSSAAEAVDLLRNEECQRTRNSFAGAAGSSAATTAAPSTATSLSSSEKDLFDLDDESSSSSSDKSSTVIDEKTIQPKTISESNRSAVETVSEIRNESSNSNHYNNNGNKNGNRGFLWDTNADDSDLELDEEYYDAGNESHGNESDTKRKKKNGGSATQFLFYGASTTQDIAATSYTKTSDDGAVSGANDMFDSVKAFTDESIENGRQPKAATISRQQLDCANATNPERETTASLSSCLSASPKAFIDDSRTSSLNAANHSTNLTDSSRPSSRSSLHDSGRDTEAGSVCNQNSINKTTRKSPTISNRNFFDFLDDDLDDTSKDEDNDNLVELLFPNSASNDVNANKKGKVVATTTKKEEAQSVANDCNGSERRCERLCGEAHSNNDSSIKKPSSNCLASHNENFFAFLDDEVDKDGNGGNGNGDYAVGGDLAEIVPVLNANDFGGNGQGHVANNAREMTIATTVQKEVKMMISTSEKKVNHDVSGLASDGNYGKILCERGSAKQCNQDCATASTVHENDSKSGRVGAVTSKHATKSLEDVHHRDIDDGIKNGQLESDWNTRKTSKQTNKSSSSRRTPLVPKSLFSPDAEKKVSTFAAPASLSPLAKTGTLTYTKPAVVGTGETGSISLTSSPIDDFVKSLVNDSKAAVESPLKRSKMEEKVIESYDDDTSSDDNDNDDSSEDGSGDEESTTVGSIAGTSTRSAISERLILSHVKLDRKNGERDDDGDNNDDSLDLLSNRDEAEDDVGDDLLLSTNSSRKYAPLEKPSAPNTAEVDEESYVATTVPLDLSLGESRNIDIGDSTHKPPSMTPVNPYKKKPSVSKKAKIVNKTPQSIVVEKDKKDVDDAKTAIGIDPYLKHQQSKSPSSGQSSPAVLSNRTELQRLGIEHSDFKPPPYQPTPDPIVHHLDSKNRPPNSRRNISVNSIFSHPINKLWKSLFKSFNHVQSEMVQTLANSDDNAIISAPTGAGKTVLFEMAMARMFASNLVGKHLQHNKQGGIGGVINMRKAVYIAPSKALCEERQADWSKRIADIDPGITCTTITGDATTSSSCYAEIASAHLILTTPEKWDSITRRWNEYVVLLGSVKLVLVDEVHMIGEAERGSCLESVLSRMKTIHRAATARKLTPLEIATSSFKHTNPDALASNMRIIAVSATLPNVAQIASFIESGEAFAFDISYRSVPLKTHVVACGFAGNNRYMFDKNLDKHVPQLLRRFSSGRPAIVFCHSKKDTMQLAEELTKSYSNHSKMDTSALMNFSYKASSASLQGCLRKGIAYHHAGLDAEDRRLVEEAFSSGNIACLCATSTLAMGVNLPSHLVIIKGTSAYRGAGNGHQDIDTGTLLQMIGRAGRPGFDTTGTAVIMTDSQSQRRYENISHGLKVVESHLMKDTKLIEVLNIEISQGVIQSIGEAVDWIKGTFLYKRLQSNPLMYGMNGNGSDLLHSFIFDKCSQSIEQLMKVQAISMEEDGTITPTSASRIMSRNFVDYDTMKSIVKLHHDSGPLQILQMLSNCQKIQFPVRRHEKKPLNEAHKYVRYKMEGPASKVRVQSPEEKVFVMLQAAVGQHYFPDFSLRQEMSQMIDGASRILSAVEEYARECSRHGRVAEQALLLRRSLAVSLWGENDGVLNQIAGVGQDTTAKLKSNNIYTFADVLSSSSDDIEKACNRSHPFGNNLRGAVFKILQHTLKLSACLDQDEYGQNHVVIKLVRRESGAIAAKEDLGKKVVTYSLLVYSDRPGGLLMFSEDISMESKHTVQCPTQFGRLYIRLVSSLIGLDEQVAIDGSDHIEKSSFSLSPASAKSFSAKKKTKLMDSHRNAVSNVSDVRIHKKRSRMEKSKRGIVKNGGEAISEHDLPCSDSAVVKQSMQSVVTPSPHQAPLPKFKNNSNLTPVRETPSTVDRRTTECLRDQNSAVRSLNAVTPKESNGRSQDDISFVQPQNSTKRMSTHAWYQERKKQKSIQQTSFNSPKENPFSQYSFDPNKIEASLDAASSRSKKLAEQSIFPFPTENSGVASSTKPRFRSTFRTPNTRRKKNSTSTRVSSTGLLQQKAIELQQLHVQAPTPMNHARHRNANMGHSDFSRPDGSIHEYGDSGMGYVTKQMNPYNQRHGALSRRQINQPIAMTPAPAVSPPFLTRPTSHHDVIQQQSIPRRSVLGYGRPVSSAGYSMHSNFNSKSFGHENYKGISAVQNHHHQFHNTYTAPPGMHGNGGPFSAREQYFTEINGAGGMPTNPRIDSFYDPFTRTNEFVDGEQYDGSNEYFCMANIRGPEDAMYGEYGGNPVVYDERSQTFGRHPYDQANGLLSTRADPQPPCQEVLVPTSQQQSYAQDTSFDDAFFD